MRAKEDNPNAIHIVVLGDMAVGKSCLIWSYNDFIDEPSNPSRVDPALVQKTISLEREEWQLSLWDGVGHYAWADSMQDQINASSVIMVVFGIGRKESFDNVTTKWLSKVRTRDVPIILVGHNPTNADTSVVAKSDIDHLLSKTGNENVTYVTTNYIEVRERGTPAPPDVTRAFKTAIEKGLPIAHIARTQSGESAVANQSTANARQELKGKLESWKAQRKQQQGDDLFELLRSTAAFFGCGYTGDKKIAAVNKFLNERTRKNLSDEEINILLQPRSRTSRLFNDAGLNHLNIKGYTLPPNLADDDTIDASAGAGASASAV